MTKEDVRVLNDFVFISPPQNAKKEGMGASLIESNPHFSNTIARIDALTGSNCLNPNLGYSPVVFAIAIHDALVQVTNLRPNIVAGLSVGENASLVQGGAIKLDDMTKILVIREELTGAGRSEAENRHMIAFRGIPLEVEDQQEALSTFLIQDPHLKHLYLANTIGPIDGVLSGETEDWEIAVQKLKDLSGGLLAEGRRVVATKLDMPDAFHSVWMQDQQAEFRKKLDELNIIKAISRPTLCRIYSPMMKKEIESEEDVYAAITQQLTTPVDISNLCKRIRRCRFVVTADPTGITPKILKNNMIENVFNISDAASFEFVAEKLRGAAK